jgi:hypothetical protein
MAAPYLSPPPNLGPEDAGAATPLLRCRERNRDRGRVDVSFFFDRYNSI